MSVEVLESIRALLPTIGERAAHTETECAVSSETVSALRDSGLFRMFQPRSHGGAEGEPREFFSAIRHLSSACGSTGWVASVVGATAWHAALFEKQTVDDIWGSDQDSLLSSSYAPVGKLRAERGGYRVSGTWRSVPGAEHCSWFMLGTLLIGDGGEPSDFTTALIPRDDVSVTDSHEMVGLRGACSKDVTVRNAFVPAHRINASAGRTRIAEEQRTNVAPVLYRVPFAVVHSLAVTIPLIGAAEGGYRYFLSRAKSRNQLPRPGRLGVEDAFSHALIGRGLTELDATILQVDRDLRELYSHAEQDKPVPMELRLRARRDQVRGAERSVAAIDGLLKVAGGHAVRTSTPIERAWRDIHTGAAYLVNDVEQGMSLYGRWAYGLGVDDSLILV